MRIHEEDPKNYQFARNVGIGGNSSARITTTVSRRRPTKDDSRSQTQPLSSMAHYYDLSPDNSSDDGVSLSSDDDDDNDGGGRDNWRNDDHDNSHNNRNHVNDNNLDDDLWGRTIIHLDVDCFYAQAEEIDRGLRRHPNEHRDQPPRPLAVGQKHIIVTCNYEARKYGVQKLSSRQDAMRACPDLWIVEGSDLRHYRNHSREIYQSFRTTVKRLMQDVGNGGNGSGGGGGAAACKDTPPCRKGCMDEMMADLTLVVNQMMMVHQCEEETNSDRDMTSTTTYYQNHPSLFVFGEDSSKVVRLVEDQTGAAATVSFESSGLLSQQSPTRLAECRRNIHETYPADRVACERRLQLGARLASRICLAIQKETGFHTTSGVSVNPLLAKICSGLQKPNSVNVLYPWRTSALLYNMPLRKLNDIGYRTMKALGGAIRSKWSDEMSSGQEPQILGASKITTVSDLLKLPRESIVQSLQGLHSLQNSSPEKCDAILDRCRGLDPSLVIDDEGGLPKTVSVENSFRRGTVRSMDAVWKALDDLFVRLPQLLQDRSDSSEDPSKSFPTTLRLTARTVDYNLSHKRRPYTTHSKQTKIRGKALLEAKSVTEQAALLKEWIKPLAQQLLLTPGRQEDIDVTRLNIAATNFQDGTRSSSLFHTPTSQGKGHVPASHSQSGLNAKRKIDTVTTTSAKATKTSKSFYSSDTSSKAKLQPNKMKSTRIDSFFTKSK